METLVKISIAMAFLFSVWGYALQARAAVSAVHYDDGRIDLYVPNLNNRIQVNRLGQDGTWSGWQYPFTSGDTTSIAVATFLDKKNNKVRLARVGSESLIYVNSQDITSGNWAGWVALPNTVPTNYSPEFATDSEGALFLFATSIFRSSYVIKFDSSSNSWLSWKKIGDHGAGKLLTDASLGVVKHVRSHRLKVFSKDLLGRLWASEMDTMSGSFTPWSSIELSWQTIFRTSSAARAILNRDGNVELFAISSATKQISMNTFIWSNDRWSDWQTLPSSNLGIGASDNAIGCQGLMANNFLVLYRNLNDQPFANVLTYSTGFWTGWRPTDLSFSAAGPTAAGSNSDLGAQVKRAFLEIMGREANGVDLSYWVGQLLSGISETQMRAAIQASPERAIRGAYLELLARPVDPDGLAYWLAKMAAGMTQAQMRDGIMASDEYKLRFAGPSQVKNLTISVNNTTANIHVTWDHADNFLTKGGAYGIGKFKSDGVKWVLDPIKPNLGQSTSFDFTADGPGQFKVDIYALNSSGKYSTSPSISITFAPPVPLPPPYVTGVYDRGSDNIVISFPDMRAHHYLVERCYGTSCPQVDTVYSLSDSWKADANGNYGATARSCNKYNLCSNATATNNIPVGAPDPLSAGSVTLTRASGTSIGTIAYPASVAADLDHYQVWRCFNGNPGANYSNGRNLGDSFALNGLGNFSVSVAVCSRNSLRGCSSFTASRDLFFQMPPVPVNFTFENEIYLRGKFTWPEAATMVRLTRCYQNADPVNCTFEDRFNNDVHDVFFSANHNGRYLLYARAYFGSAEGPVSDPGIAYINTSAPSTYNGPLRLYLSWDSNNSTAHANWDGGLARFDGDYAGTFNIQRGWIAPGTGIIQGSVVYSAGSNRTHDWGANTGGGTVYRVQGCNQQAGCGGWSQWSATVFGILFVPSKGVMIAAHSLSGMAIEVDGVSSNNYAVIQQYPRTGGNNQILHFDWRGGNAFQLRFNHSGKCIDDPGAKQTNGPVQQYTCLGVSNQTFLARAVPGGIQFKAQHNGKCLDISGWSQDGRARLQTWNCGADGQPNQTFVFAPVQ